MKEQFNSHAWPTQEYSPGDRVYLESTNIKTNCPSKKLDKHFGPFEIIKKIGQSAYKLKLPTSWQGLHPIFNESYLSPYRPSQFSRQTRPPPPPLIEVEDKPEYEVEEIQDSRCWQGHLQYLIHWKGYPHEEDTWKPILNLTNIQRLINEFHQRHPNKPSQTNDVQRINFSCDDTCLYNPTMNTPRTSVIIPSQTTSLNMIVSVLMVIVMTLLGWKPDEFDFPWEYFPPIPQHVRWVWLYETDPIHAISSVIQFNECSSPISFFKLNNPVTKHMMIKKYNFNYDQMPAAASDWLAWDYYKFFCRIWWLWGCNSDGRVMLRVWFVFFIFVLFFMLYRSFSLFILMFPHLW